MSKKEEYQSCFSDVFEELEKNIEPEQPKQTNQMSSYNNARSCTQQMPSSKIFVLNALGLVLGLLVGALSGPLVTVLFSGLARVKFIIEIFDLFIFLNLALIAVFLTEIFSSAYVCKFFCKKSKAKYNYGNIGIFIINLIIYIYSFIPVISSWDFCAYLLPWIFAFVSIIITLNMCKNKELDTQEE